MKTFLVAILWVVSASFAVSKDLKDEARFIGFLHQLQYAETHADFKKLIPDCPPPQADVGENNTEIIVKTKLFGFDASGEFNFHKGILVSHGFEIHTPDFQDAHRVFLEAVSILDSQVNGLKLSAALPFGLDGEDSSDGPKDEININVDGIDRNASFQLRLDMRGNSTVVRWGAQKVRPPLKKANG